MKNYFILIFMIIKFYFCCEDVNKISLSSPFKDLNEIQTILGEDIIFKCCHPDGADSLHWENNKGRVISFDSDGGIFTLKDEKKNLILRIDNINKNGFGLYSCKHPTRKLVRSISISQKSISMSPKIMKKELFIPKNKPVEIKCPLIEQQTFKAWIFTEGGQNVVKNKPIKTKNYEISEDKLTFLVKRYNDIEFVKIVWCQYQEINLDGDLLTGLYELTWILYDPIDVSVVMTNTQPILEGHDVNLICYFNEYNAQVVSFPNNIMKSTFILQTLKDHVNLTIPKITKNLEGQYECKVTKFLSYEPFKIAEETSIIQVDVIVSPKIVKKNSMETTASLDGNAFLACDIMGQYSNKTVIFFERFDRSASEWMKLKDERYTMKIIYKKDRHSMILTIKNVKWSDRGKYRCIAANQAGRDIFNGAVRVEKTPDLYFDNIVYMAIEPVRINCSVSGYPTSNSSDFLDLRIVNETTSVVLKYVNRIYDELDGLIVIYDVVVKRELVKEETYLLECFYHNDKKKTRKTKTTQLQMLRKPDIPKVTILCSGSSGVVFQYEKPKINRTEEEITKNELIYSVSADESLMKRVSKVLPIKLDNNSSIYTYVLEDLFPNTNYTFVWKSYNKFQISNFVTLYSETKKFSPPPKPKAVEFIPNVDVVSIALKWDDNCPYDGVNSPIKDVVVNMKPALNENDKFQQNWNLVESNITVDMAKSKLQFTLFLEKPKTDYEVTNARFVKFLSLELSGFVEDLFVLISSLNCVWEKEMFQCMAKMIQVRMRSYQGSSEYIKVDYKADVVLAGLFSCFPRCSAKSLLSCLIAWESSIITLIILWFTYFA